MWIFIFFFSLFALSPHTFGHSDGLVLLVTHDPFLCTQAKETCLHDKSQHIPEAFTLMPVGLVKNKCVVACGSAVMLPLTAHVQILENGNIRLSLLSICLLDFK